MTKIIIDNDTSEWAFKSFEACSKLLVAKKRWPDKFGIEYSGRKQNNMTRDPYVAFGACYSHLLGYGNDEVLNEQLRIVDPPIKLWFYSPGFILWWMRLLRNNKKQFVQRLGYFRAIAAKNIFEKKYEDNFYD